MYGIPVEVEVFDIESNLFGSVPSEDIVTGDPVIIGLNPNMAFKSLNPISTGGVFSTPCPVNGSELHNGTS